MSLVEATHYVIFFFCPQKTNAPTFNRKQTPPILHNLIHKTEQERTLSKPFWKANIILIPFFIIIKRKLQTNTSHEHKCKKILNKILANKVHQYMKIGFILRI